MNDEAERRLAAHYAPPAPPPWNAPPHAPYRPPYAVPPYVPRAGVRSPFLKWLFAATAMAALFVALVVYLVPLPAPMMSAVRLMLPLLAMSKGLLGGFWLYGAWSELPPAYLREIKETPGNVVVMYFVPFYNVYWAFASQSRLCTGIDTLLARADFPPRAPRALALLAPVLHIASTLIGLTKEPVLIVVGTTAAAAGWFAMMFAFDRALGEMHRALARAPAVANGG